MLHKNDPNITDLNISMDDTYHVDLFYQIIRLLDYILENKTEWTWTRVNSSRKISCPQYISDFDKDLFLTRQCLYNETKKDLGFKHFIDITGKLLKWGWKYHTVDFQTLDVLPIRQCGILTVLRVSAEINDPNRINQPSSRPQWSLFSLSLVHIFTTGSAARADLFYWDGLPVILFKKVYWEKINIANVFKQCVQTEIRLEEEVFDPKFYR